MLQITMNIEHDTLNIVSIYDLRFDGLRDLSKDKKDKIHCLLSFTLVISSFFSIKFKT